jgi:hypothetical protein
MRIPSAEVFMGMTPDQFFESFVEGNLLDCHNAPGDIRRAFNAAVAASHFADHYFNFNKRHNPAIVAVFDNFGAFVEHLSTQTNTAFRDIRSISNAYKHLYTNIDKKKAVYSSIDSTGSIESIELCNSEDVTMIEEEYLNSEVPQENTSKVVFTRKDGTKAEFLQELESVVEYFRNLVYRHA